MLPATWLLAILCLHSKQKIDLHETLAKYIIIHELVARLNCDNYAEKFWKNIYLLFQHYNNILIRHEKPGLPIMPFKILE